jgi:hypothetical protein
MERYTLSKHYAVSVDTKYRRHKTWSNSVRLIDAAGVNEPPKVIFSVFVGATPMPAASGIVGKKELHTQESSLCFPRQNAI